MTFDELTPEQKLQAKQAYLNRLADEGRLMRFLYGTDAEEERGPTWEELADADELIPDEIMRSDGADYVAEDFGTDGYEVRDCDKILRWAVNNITFDKLTEDHPKAIFLHRTEIGSAVRFALEWAREKVARKCSEMVME